jgi:Flp pilus assembly protein TadG
MRRRTLRHTARGTAAIEFGLLIAPLILMIFGTTEVGRAIYTYNTLDKSVRDAARHLSQHGPGDTTIATQARCLAVYGNTGCTGAVLAPGLTTGAVTICDAATCPGTHASQPTGSGVVNLVTVTVTGYAFNSVMDGFVPDITFSDIAVTLRAQL